MERSERGSLPAIMATLDDARGIVGRMAAPRADICILHLGKQGQRNISRGAYNTIQYHVYLVITHLLDLLLHLHRTKEFGSCSYVDCN